MFLEDQKKCRRQSAIEIEEHINTINVNENDDVFTDIVEDDLDDCFCDLNYTDQYTVVSNNSVHISNEMNNAGYSLHAGNSLDILGNQDAEEYLNNGNR